MHGKPARAIAKNIHSPAMSGAIADSPICCARSFELFIGLFLEPGSPDRVLPKTTDASSGPSSEIPRHATNLPERLPKIAVVHGSKNQLFAMLQSVGWASSPERTAVEHMRVDHGGAHILVAE